LTPPSPMELKKGDYTTSAGGRERKEGKEDKKRDLIMNDFHLKGEWFQGKEEEKRSKKKKRRAGSG